MILKFPICVTVHSSQLKLQKPKHNPQHTMPKLPPQSRTLNPNKFNPLPKQPSIKIQNKFQKSQNSIVTPPPPPKQDNNSPAAAASNSESIHFYKTASETDLVEYLYQPVPKEFIKMRSGGGSRKLSYITAKYCHNELDKCFGPSGWYSEIEDKEYVENNEGERTQRIQIAIYVTKGPFQGMIRRGVGGESKTISNKKQSTIDVVKSAESDAFKRACRGFGNRLGFSLYK